MFRLAVQWYGRNAHVLFRAKGEDAFLLAVEGNPKDSRSSEPGVMAGLVEEAEDEFGSELVSPESPAGMAIAMDAVLRRWELSSTLAISRSL